MSLARSPVFRSLFVAVGVLGSSAVTAQDSSRPTGDPIQARSAIEAWGFDPSVLVADGEQLLRRAPDPAVDELFQTFLVSSRSPAQADVLCGLFDPQADRSLAGLNAAAARLDDAARQRFANAVATMFVAAAQNPPQAFDAVAAGKLLRQAGVRATMLDDRFMPGLNGNDHPARCRSIGQLLEAMQPRPVAERAAVTRLLLIEGLRYVGTDGAMTGRDSLL